MPQLRKNKWLGAFLELVEDDLSKLAWHSEFSDNLTLEERKARVVLHEAEGLLVKKNDKGWNAVLSEENYEKEARRLLGDGYTFKNWIITHFLPLSLWLTTSCILHWTLIW